MTGYPPCFGHPTKVTFTFNDKCLRDSSIQQQSSSFWDTHPYNEATAYNMQKWLSQKMKSQKEKVKIERAVRRAEKKLQDEYTKQMDLKKAAAQQQFKMWLKSKGFADQSPVMLHRGAHYCDPRSRSHTACPASREDPVKGGEGKQNKNTRGSSAAASTRKSSGSQRNIQRPKSASNVLSGRRSRSEEGRRSKSLCAEDYMKMKHIAGKRYQKLKEERTEFLCEDALLRKLQNLEWEEKCIKTKLVDEEKEELSKVRSRALSRRRKKKLKFKGDVITVEVEDVNANNVQITFHEEDDHCSDIGCIEKEGIDFHIESRETIDFTASERTEEEPPCQPKSAAGETPCRPKSARQQRSSPEGGGAKSGSSIPTVVVTDEDEITSKPLDAAAKPVDEAAKPVDEAAKPVDAAAKTVDEAAKPVDEAVIRSTDESRTDSGEGVSTKGQDDAVKSTGAIESAGDAAKSTSDIAKSTGDTAAKSTSDAAKSIGDAAKSTGDAAKSTGDAAKSTGDAAESGGDSTTTTNPENPTKIHSEHDVKTDGGAASLKDDFFE